MKKLMYTILVLLMMTLTASATNGYFAHGYGTQSKAMAGSGVALAFSHLGAANNPASIAFMPKGLDINVSAFMPFREYTFQGMETVESGSKFFLVPAIGLTYRLNEKNAFNLAIYGNGGMNTDYEANTFPPDPTTGIAAESKTGVNLSQLFTGLTWSYKLNDRHSIGLSAIFAYQMFEAKGLSAFTYSSGDAENFNDNGTDNSTGFGFKVGYQGHLSEKLWIGASYQSKMSMSEFDKYAGLFAEKGDFDIPATWTAGIAVMPAKKWTIAFDLQQIMYSDVKSIANKLDLMQVVPMIPDGQGGMVPNPNFVPLGSDKGAGFGWRDMTVFKFGVQFHRNEMCFWRAGYSIGSQPIPSSQVLFNILAPGVIQQHATLGLTRILSGKKAISVAITHAFSNTVTGQNPMAALQMMSQDIDIKMNQWDIEFGFTF